MFRNNFSKNPSQKAVGQIVLQVLFCKGRKVANPGAEDGKKQVLLRYKPGNNKKFEKQVGF